MSNPALIQVKLGSDCFVNRRDDERELEQAGARRDSGSKHPDAKGCPWRAVLSAEENRGDMSGKLEEEFGREAQSILGSRLRVSQDQHSDHPRGPRAWSTPKKRAQNILGIEAWSTPGIRAQSTHWNRA